jgi:hypothetical protein
MSPRCLLRCVYGVLLLTKQALILNNRDVTSCNSNNKMHPQRATTNLPNIHHWTNWKMFEPLGLKIWTWSAVAVPSTEALIGVSSPSSYNTQERSQEIHRRAVRQGQDLEDFHHHEEHGRRVQSNCSTHPTMRSQTDDKSRMSRG